MRDETIALLDAAAEAIRQRWPHVAVCRLPEERVVSRRSVAVPVFWPGYRNDKKEPGNLLLFRQYTQMLPEAVDDLLDPRKIALATDECRSIAWDMDRMAQEILDSQRAELDYLTAEANALAAAGLVPADFQGETRPVSPVAYRVVSLTSPRLNTSHDRLMQIVTSGELPVRMENRDFVQSFVLTVMESPKTALQMRAELHMRSTVFVSWQAVVDGMTLPIPTYPFSVCVERVAAVCPSPRQAILLARRLDTIRRVFEN